VVSCTPPAVCTRAVPSRSVTVLISFRKGNASCPSLTSPHWAKPALGKARTGQSPHWAKPALALAAISLIGLTAARPASAQNTTVYSNNFTNGAGPEFSNNSTSTTPGTAAHAPDKFLGEFGNQSTTLTLNGLATHSTVNVTFDLYMIRSMDGNGPFGGGPDPWSVSENGNTLLSTNFANFPGDTQSFGGPNGSGGYLTGGTYAPQTGATEANTLGYQFNGSPEDAVYHLSFTFNDASSALALNFLGQPNEALSNESWGLDNVVVKTNAAPVPETGTSASLGLLLALGLGSLAIARRRKASASAE